MPRENELAYSVSSSLMNKKSFPTWSTWGECLKTFFLVVDEEAK
jgi:hypothetical protein